MEQRPWHWRRVRFVVLGLALLEVVLVILLQSWLRHNWPAFSSDWEMPFGSLTDVIGLGIGLVVLGVTVGVALYQVSLMQRQMTLMERADVISDKQWQISRRQDQLLQDKEARSPRFRVWPYMPAAPYDSLNVHYEGVECQLTNDGVDAARNVSWMFGVTDNQWVWELRDSASQLVDTELEFIENASRFVTKGSKPDIFFRHTGTRLPSVYVSTKGMSGTVNLIWQVRCDEGTFPKDGFGRLSLVIQSDGSLIPEGGWK